LRYVIVELLKHQCRT